MPPAQLRPILALTMDGTDPDTVERVSTALALAGWRADLSTRWRLSALSRDVRSFVAIRDGLSAGVLLMLGFAAAALLAMCLQQVRDARRPLAALAAAGVPRAVLARSLLWQNAILTGTAVLLADVAGVALGLLLLPAAEARPAVDWPAVGLPSAAAVAAAAATLATLPAVRTATRPTALRTEWPRAGRPGPLAPCRSSGSGAALPRARQAGRPGPPPDRTRVVRAGGRRGRVIRLGQLQQLHSSTFSSARGSLTAGAVRRSPGHAAQRLGEPSPTAFS